MSDSYSNALIIGCGYLGTRVGTRLAATGLRVVGTTRSEARREEITRASIEATMLDLDRLEETSVLDETHDLVVYAIAPGRGEDPRHTCVDGPISCLDALNGVPAPRFVFISSTGVFSEQDGSELDESSPTTASNEPHASLAEAERQLLDRGAMVARLGGLYGPARSPIDWVRRPEFRERLRKSRHAQMNWIHIDDAADLVVAALLRGRPGEIYLGVDGHPVTRGDFFGFAAELAGVGPPALGDDPRELGKRLSHRKAAKELGFSPSYPDYRVGLRSLAGDDSA